MRALATRYLPAILAAATPGRSAHRYRRVYEFWARGLRTYGRECLRRAVLSHEIGAALMPGSFRAITFGRSKPLGYETEFIVVARSGLTGRERGRERLADHQHRRRRVESDSCADTRRRDGGRLQINV